MGEHIRKINWKDSDPKKLGFQSKEFLGITIFLCFKWESVDPEITDFDSCY
jgi:hypothetical protein